MPASPLVLIEPAVREKAPAWLARVPAAETVQGADLVERAVVAADSGPVICVGTDRSVLLGVSGLPGVAAVRLAAETQVNVLSDPAMATAHTAAELASLFDGGPAEVILSLFRQRPSDVRAAIDRRIASLLASAREAGGLTIYAAGTIGRQALDAARLAGIPVKAFIDGNPALAGTQVDRVPVGPPTTIEPGRDIVVPALGRHVAAVTKTVRQHGARDVMSLSELFFATRRPGEPETDYIDDLFANRHRYLSLFLAAADPRSREVLAAVVRHRLTLASEPLEGVVEQGHAQWFDPAFLPRQKKSVFVDGGAFDGDTVLGFVKAFGNGYGRIHAFELDPEVAARARERTRAIRGVTIHNVGLSDRSGTVPYRRTGGTDGSIAAATGGEQQVAIGTIDATVPERVSFLKLDVEGEEARSLRGARRHIIEDRPTIAIALYHKAHDLWDLPRRILDYSPSYRLHLRHYTDVAYETIAYAIPS